MKTLKERIEGLDLTTAEGIKAARQAIRAYGRDASIKDFNQLLETQPAEDETQNDWFHNLQQLLEDVDSCNKALERPHPKVIHWNDIEVIDRDWLIPNWLPAHTATMFTGDGGVGKSWLTLQVVCQITCGFKNAFLNPEFPLPSEADESIKPKHIVFATYEDEPAEIKRRIQALASGMNWVAESLDTIKQHLHIVDMRGIGSVWGPGMGKHIANTGDLLFAGEAIRAICEERNAKLLVIDPLSGAFGGNENDRTAVYDFVSSFRGWGDAAKCAMLAIGHLPKGAEGRAAGFSGSTAWEASARSMWKLSKKVEKPEKGEEDEEEKAYWVMEHTKGNYTAPQPEIFLVKQASGWWVQVPDKETAIAGFRQYQADIAAHSHEEKYEDTEIPSFSATQDCR